MKRSVLLSILFGAMPLLSMAQDDLYFVPSKAEKSAYQQKKMEENRTINYSGINMSNDEYNRRGIRNYKKIGTDSLGNDIIMSRISTQHGDSLVLDTIYGGLIRHNDYEDEDFTYSRRMSRFDDFWGGYYDPWFAGRSSFYVGWGWHSPYYGGWYDRWAYPWGYAYYGGYPYYSYYGGYPYYSYYGGYPYYYAYTDYAWYSPWDRYYSYYGGYPYYDTVRSRRYAYNGHTGTANHWGNSPRTFNSQSGSSTYSNGQSSFSSHRNNGNSYNNTTSPRNNMNNYYDRFGGARQRSVDSQPMYSQPSPSSFGGASRSSFGGSYSGGGSSSGTPRSSFGSHR